MRKPKLLPGLIDFGWFWKNPPSWAMRPGLDMLRALFHAANLPVIRRFHPWTQVKKTNMYWIPVNKTLERDPSVPLPYEVVERLIDESSARTIMNFCGCRASYNCKRFPTEIGCLMMGPDADRIPAHWSRKATKEEAKAHLHKAVEAGLPPFVGKARIDNFIFGVPDNGKLLTVCFCCDCCCITDILKHVPREEREQIVHPLDGLEIFVDQDLCMGCGQCAEHCVLDAISLSSGTAEINAECRGCGRCVPMCPENAIKIRLDNPGFVEKAVASIKRSVKP
ncbi:MAG: 4Fe-4S binding protein [Thermodesulfobacteriota bacterium]